jgi:hypothetical protein
MFLMPLVVRACVCDLDRSPCTQEISGSGPVVIVCGQVGYARAQSVSVQRSTRKLRAVLRGDERESPRRFAVHLVGTIALTATRAPAPHPDRDA